jgi:hypothetical protein
MTGCRLPAGAGRDGAADGIPPPYSAASSLSVSDFASEVSQR